jgi:hypothetical protein
MASELDKLLKRLKDAKKEALAKGLVAIAPIAAAPAVAVALEAPEEHNDAPASNPRSVVISAVGAYLEALKKLPRQLLEARYLKDVGEPCPNVCREWIIEKMARKMQTEQYLFVEGSVPASVLRYNKQFEVWRPAQLDDEEDNDDEPRKDEMRFDPTMRAKAIVQCPFSRGRGMLIFQTVASQPNGIQYNALVLLLKTINDWPQAKAEGKAQRVFTKWVDNGWVELI